MLQCGTKSSISLYMRKRTQPKAALIEYTNWGRNESLTKFDLFGQFNIWVLVNLAIHYKSVQFKKEAEKDISFSA